MSIRRAFVITSTALGLVLALMVAAMLMAGRAGRSLAAVEQRRYESYKLADELRQSSDELTRMVRSYAATANPAYLERFRQILAIREGRQARPGNYGRSQWTLANAGAKPDPPGEAASLVSRMKAMHFTKDEIALLSEAKRQSDELVRLEDRAFAAVQGKFDDGSGRFTVEKEPDPALARRLLYGEEYLHAKAGIMATIDRFFDSVESRTNAQVRQARSRESFFRSLTWPLGLLAIALCALAGHFLRRRAVVPLHRLSRHAAALSQGKYGQHTEPRGFSELRELCTAFNSMSDAIVRDIDHRAAVQEDLRKTRNIALRSLRKVKEDLEAAAHVQQALLPSVMPDTPGVGFTYAYAPCDELAGDTLNIFSLDAHHIALYMVDVSGHGVQAAMLASTLSHVLTPLKGADSVLWEKTPAGFKVASPATVAGKLNDRFPMNPDTNQYFTIHYGVLDTRALAYRFISAGHPAPIFLRGGQDPQRLQAKGAGIGILPDPEFEVYTVQLAASDRLVFVSDGILEAVNEQDIQFQDRELFSCLEAASGMDMEETMNHLIRSVADWSHGRQQDDISALLMQITRQGDA